MASEKEIAKRQIEADMIEDDASKHRESLSDEARKPRFSGNGLPPQVREFTDKDRSKWADIGTPPSMNDRA